MDISRLPAAGHASGGIYRAPARTASIATAAPAGGRGPAAVAPASERERVVQGELLQRERGAYQSTRAYIDERGLEFAQAGDAAGHSRIASGGRAALARYLNHAQVESLSDRLQGRSVNYFV